MLYRCTAGSKFDTDENGVGDADHVDTWCRWDEVWHPWTSLPPCVITHCISPPAIPADAGLRAVSSGWTSINTHKQYDCGRQWGRYTGFWSTDRSRSTFSILCKSDGNYDFVNDRDNWPTCLQDVTCPLPPEIPTHPDYSLADDDGYVSYQSLMYPQLTRRDSSVNSTHNNTALPRNYAANLTYHCGAARQFVRSDGSTVDTLTMTCGWDRSWSGDTDLLPCDWVACLQPPKPPASTNLRHADWFGDIIPFGGWVRFVCERGMMFEDEPELEYVEYQCQDGSEEDTERGYFMIPSKDEDWPRCLHSPLCPAPPELPHQGFLNHSAPLLEVRTQDKCQTDGSHLSLTCPSFLRLDIRYPLG